MVNVQKLKGSIVEKGKTQQEVAAMIGVDRTTFYRKMKNGGNFSIEEVGKIAEAVPLSDEEAITIFFDRRVAKTLQEEKV